MMLRPRNLLALDEPTNHLDIPAREVLEEALDDYEGTIIVVTHDRYFLDRVCTRIVDIDGDGASKRTSATTATGAGARRRSSAQAAKAAAKAPPPKPRGGAARPPSTSAAARDADKQREREPRRLARRVETLEADVSKLEAELAAVRAELGADHAGDWQKLHALADRERELDALLARRIAEWEAASAAALNPPPVIHRLTFLNSDGACVQAALHRSPSPSFDRVNLIASLREGSGCGSLVLVFARSRSPLAAAPPVAPRQRPRSAADAADPAAGLRRLGRVEPGTTIGEGIGAGDTRIEKQEWHLTQAGSAITGYYIAALTFVSGDGRPYVCSRQPQFSATQRFDVTGRVRDGHIEIEELGLEIAAGVSRCDPGVRRLARYRGRLDGDVLTLIGGGRAAQTLYRIRHPGAASPLFDAAERRPEPGASGQLPHPPPPAASTTVAMSSPPT